MAEQVQTQFDQSKKLNLALLVTRPGKYESHLDQIQSAIISLGHDSQIIYSTDPLEKTSKYDSVITRTPIFGSVKVLENNNIAVLNSSSGIEIANDKWLTYQFLQKNNIPTTPTFFLNNRDDLVYVLDEINQNKQAKYFVSKSRFGAGGQGIERFSINFKEDVIKLDAQGYLPVIQKFRNVSCDYKLLVVGGVVERVVYRKILPHDFRSNACSGTKQIHFPGTLNLYKQGFDGQNYIDIGDQQVSSLSDSDFESMVNLACKTVKLLNLGLASVDFTFDEEGRPEILEVDASPWLPNIVQLHPAKNPELNNNQGLYTSIALAATMLARQK